MREADNNPEGPWRVAAGTSGNRRFGGLVKNLRERSGLSPQQIADQADVHVSFVRGIERGVQAPSLTKARRLLACMKEQSRVRWVEGGPFDLVIRDPKIGRDVAFEFKAKVRGQNRRPDTGPVAALNAMSEVWLPVMQQLRDELGIAPQVAQADHGPASVDTPYDKPRSSTTATDAVFGRVVRLLATADYAALRRIELLLGEDSGRGHAGS